MAINHPADSISGAQDMAGWCWTGPGTLLSVREAAIGAREFLERLGMGRDECAKWELLLTEAGNNAVIHDIDECRGEALEVNLLAGGHRIIARVTVIARVTDHGEGFDWPVSVELPDPAKESGRGLYLIQTLSDVIDYQRGSSGNTLIMESRSETLLDLHGGQASSELEATLDEMTEELAGCYESLSALFRFTEESRADGTIEELGLNLLKSLAAVTGSDCGVLSLLSPDSGELKRVASLVVTADDDWFSTPESLEIKRTALDSRKDQWIESDPAESAGPGCSTPPASGLAHPFYDHDEPVGVLTLARLHRAEPLRAGEVNVIRTLSEFFMQRVMSFRFQEASIEAQLNRRELELAAGIQKSLLPMSLPAVPGFSAVGHCESALAVGGDFYDAFPGKNGGLIFAIADVMGKGVGASMVAAITRAAIRSAVAHFETPAGMLEHAGKLLFDDLDRLEMFVTVVIGLVDPERGVVEIANAGHCPVLLAGPDGEVRSAPPLSVPLGLEPVPEISQSSFPLDEGTCLLAFTDGLIDPRAAQNFESPEAVAGWLKANTTNGPTAAEVKEALLDRLQAAAGAALLADDQTFLVIARDTTPNHQK